MVYIAYVMVILFVKSVTCQQDCNGYQIEDIDGNTLCMNCTQCPPGQGVEKECTNNSDTVCRPCVQGETYSSMYSAVRDCEPCTHCSPHQELINTCIVTQNARCGNCYIGYFKNELTDMCEECSYCFESISYYQKDCDVKGVPARFHCMAIRNTPYPPPPRYTTVHTHTSVTLQSTSPSPRYITPDEDISTPGYNITTARSPQSSGMSTFINPTLVPIYPANTNTLALILIGIFAALLVIVLFFVFRADCCKKKILVILRKKSDQQILSATDPVEVEHTDDSTICVLNDEATPNQTDTLNVQSEGPQRQNSGESGYSSERNDVTEDNDDPAETDAENSHMSQSELVDDDGSLPLLRNPSDQAGNVGNHEQQLGNESLYFESTKDKVNAYFSNRQADVPSISGYASNDSAPIPSIYVHTVEIDKENDERSDKEPLVRNQEAEDNQPRNKKKINKIC
ncbi:uncharacterized protein LOC144438972 [Glandiceps talaboti]